MIRVDLRASQFPDAGPAGVIQNTRTTLSDLAWVAGAVLLAVVLRGFRLDQNSLWVDEYVSLTIALSPMAEMPAAAMRDHSGYPPTYFWLLHLTIRALGEGEAALRLPSVIAGALTVPFVWLLARELTRSAWVANTSAILLAVHPLHIWYSQEARPYTLFVLFASIALWTLSVAMRWGGAGWWVAYALASALSILAHVLGMLALVIGAVWVIFRWRERGLALRFAAASALAVGLAIPFLVMLIAAESRGGSGTPPRGFTGLELPYTVFTFLAGYSLGPSLRSLQNLGWRPALFTHPGQVVLVACAAAGLVGLGARLRSAPARDLAAAFLAPIVVVGVLSLALEKPYNVRYVLPALIGFVPLVALALNQLAPSARRFGLGALLGVTLWADLRWFESAEYRKEDSRAVMGCLGRILSPGATVLVAPAYMRGTLSYYAHRQGSSLRIVGADTPAEIAASSGTEALLLTRLHHVRDPAALRRAFAGAAEAAEAPIGAAGYSVYVAHERLAAPITCEPPGRGPGLTLRVLTPASSRSYRR